MNLNANMNFVRLLARNAVKVNHRSFSYVKKYKISEKTKCNLLINPKHYCTGNSPVEFTDIMDEKTFKNITQGNPESERNVKVLIMEIESMRLEGVLVPKKFPENKWQDYLAVSGYHAKKKFLEYLAKIEFKEENAKLKKEKKALDYQSKIAEINIPDHVRYQLGHNAIFMKVNKSSISTMLNLKLLGADCFDNRIIFDMAYERYMSPRQVKECAKQLVYTFGENRFHHNPFYFHLCNYPENTQLARTMTQFFASEMGSFPLSIHKESYMDVFDRDRLVYLTPNSPYDVTHHPDNIYIIGAFIDTGASLPISFAKAKADKIRTAKFPLDRYLKWKQGNKSLTLNQCSLIVADYLYYKNWSKAFKNVPKRLIDMYDEEALEEFKRNSDYKESGQKKLING